MLDGVHGGVLVDAAPENAHWWDDLSFDERGLTEPEISWSVRHVKQIAFLVPESTSFQEAVRMAAAQGCLELSRGRGSAGNPEVEDVPEPNDLWYGGVVGRASGGVVSKKIQFTRAQVEEIAVVAGEQLSFGAAVKRCVSAALQVRAEA